jgi:hypothetical protein
MLDYIGQNKIAAKWLLEYPERRQQYIDRMSEFSTLSAVQYSGMPTGTDVGRPCENKGISLVDLDEQRLWVMSIKDTEKTLSPKKMAFLDARRWVEIQSWDQKERGRPGWVDETQVRYAKWSYNKYGSVSYPDKKTLTKWWDDIVNIAVRIAIKRGCL